MLKSLTISCQQLSRIYIPNSRNITRRSYTMAVIERATLFNVASEAEGQKIIEAYKTMKTDAKKDGKPYILSISAGTIIDPSRAGGNSVAVFAKFESVADMKYYDTEDPVHLEVKKGAKLNGPPMVVYFEDVVGN